MQSQGDYWNDWLRAYRKNIEDFINETRVLVNMDSPSREKALSDEVATYLAQRVEALGGTVERIHYDETGDCIVGRWPDEKGSFDAKPILIGGHYDTVWPAGEVAKRPFTLEDNIAKGPGIFDMKAGVVLGLQVMEQLQKQAVSLPHPVTMIISGDEEIGSIYTRSLWEKEGAASRAGLILEPSGRRERLHTARKGIASFTMFVEGIAAHAGANHKGSVSAIDELVNQIVRLHQLNDYDVGTTVNIGTIQGGMARNIIAPQAEAIFEIRTTQREETQKAVQYVEQIRPVNPKASVRVEGRITRPPMPETEGNKRLFAIAQHAAQAVGATLQAGRSGGGSDGNFIADQGTPTLDGLGIVGSGAHAYHEQIDVTTFPLRALLLTALLLRIP